MITDAVNKAARDHRERRQRKGPSHYWYPSDMGVCDRKSVLRHAGVESKGFDSETLRRFWMGDIVEVAVREAVESNLTVIGHGVGVRDEDYRVSGRMDTLILEYGKPVPCEYKSIKSTAFDYPLPQYPHVLQTGTYMEFPATCPGNCHGLCGGSGRLPVPQSGRLIYWSKDDARIKEFVLVKSATLTEDVRGTLRRLEGLYQDYLAEREAHGSKLPPALPLVPVRDKKGQPVVYKRSGPWGKAGDPKLELDFRARNCDYRGTGLCCADEVSDAREETKEAVLGVPPLSRSEVDVGQVPEVRQPGGGEGSGGG